MRSRRPGSTGRDQARTAAKGTARCARAWRSRAPVRRCWLRTRRSRTRRRSSGRPRRGGRWSRNAGCSRCPSGSFGPHRGRPGLFELRHHHSFGIGIGPGRSGGTTRRGEVPGPQHPAATRSARRHDSAVRPWKRRLCDGERSVLLPELLLRHPELVAEAEEITSTLLVAEDDQQPADEITARLRTLRVNGPVSVDTGRARVLDVLQPYLDDLTRRNERGARRAAADIATAVLLGLYECREDTDEDMLLARMGLPGATDAAAGGHAGGARRAARGDLLGRQRRGRWPVRGAGGSATARRTARTGTRTCCG